MTGSEWEQVYDLRADSDYVRLVQDASLNKPGFGFPPEPYLFGTPAWWAAINDGIIRAGEVVGTISAVYWGSMGDWPEFKLLAHDGIETTWTRRGDVTRFVEGLEAKVRYATLQPKEHPAFPEGGPRNVVLGIWVEPSDERTPLYKGYRGSAEPDEQMVRGTHSFPPSAE